MIPFTVIIWKTNAYNFPRNKNVTFQKDLNKKKIINLPSDNVSISSISGK